MTRHSTARRLGPTADPQSHKGGTRRWLLTICAPLCPTARAGDPLPALSWGRGAPGVSAPAWGPGGDTCSAPAPRDGAHTRGPQHDTGVPALIHHAAGGSGGLGAVPPLWGTRLGTPRHARLFPLHVALCRSGAAPRPRLADGSGWVPSVLFICLTHVGSAALTASERRFPICHGWLPPQPSGGTRGHRDLGTYGLRTWGRGTWGRRARDSRGEGPWGYTVLLEQALGGDEALPRSVPPDAIRRQWPVLGGGTPTCPPGRRAGSGAAVPAAQTAEKREQGAQSGSKVVSANKAALTSGPQPRDSLPWLLGDPRALPRTCR